MVKRKDKNETVKKTVNIEETEKKENKEKEEKIVCRNCQYLDTRTIRDFHRDGICKGLVEQRGKCTCEKVKARGHLVRIDMMKKCSGFVEGQFIVPEKEKKVKKKEVVENDEGKTTPSEYHGPPLTDVERKELNKNKKKHSKKQHLKSGERIIVTDPHNGDVKTFEQKGRRLVLLKQ